MAYTGWVMPLIGPVHVVLSIPDSSVGWKSVSRAGSPDWVRSCSDWAPSDCPSADWASPVCGPDRLAAMMPKRSRGVVTILRERLKAMAPVARIMMTGSSIASARADHLPAVRHGCARLGGAAPTGFPARPRRVRGSSSALAIRAAMVRSRAVTMALWVVRSTESRKPINASSRF